MYQKVPLLLLLLWAACAFAQNPGNCPPKVSLDLNNCMEDSHCERTKKCCDTALGGKACVTPVSLPRYPNARKPGNCPSPDTMWICGYGCTTDADCLGRKKCCEVGCEGRWCLLPQ